MVFLNNFFTAEELVVKRRGLGTNKSVLSNKQTHKQILYYPQTLYSVQGVKTSNKYIEISRHICCAYYRKGNIYISFSLFGLLALRIMI